MTQGELHKLYTAHIMFYVGCELINQFIQLVPKSSWKHKVKQAVNLLDQHISDPTSEWSRLNPDTAKVVNHVVLNYKQFIEVFNKVENMDQVALISSALEQIANNQIVYQDDDGVDQKQEFSQFLFEVLHHARQHDNAGLNAILNKHGFDMNQHRAYTMDRLKLLLAQAREPITKS